MFSKKTDKTALVLSGGGSRGSYQIGVCKALKELGIKLDIVVGTSVGAVNGAMVALGEVKQAEKLWQELETKEIFDIDGEDKSPQKTKDSFWGISMEEAYGYAKEVVTKGGASSIGMAKLLESYVNEDKLRKSKVSYGLVTAKVPSLKGERLFVEDMPYGKLHDYIRASASCFPAAHIYEIDGNKYIDGGYSDNMPVGMALEKNATQIIAVDLRAVGVVPKKDIEKAEASVNYKHIYSHFDLGNFLSFNPEVARTNLRYGYLDGLKAFNKLDGSIYAFKKNTFAQDDLFAVDCASAIFGANKEEVYIPQTLHEELKLKLLDVQIALHKNPLKLNGPMAKLGNISDKIDSATLVVYIAEDLRNNGSNSKFYNKLVKDFLTKEIAVAQYLVDKNLLHE